MVTHNELFLHALAQRLIVFGGDGISIFDGTYQEFLDKGGWGDEAAAPAPSASGEVPKPAAAQMNKKALRKQRSTIINERSRKIAPIAKAIAKLEAAIETAEQDLARMNEAMVAASQSGDSTRIAELSPKISTCRETIDEHFLSLEKHYERKEAVETAYDKKLSDLGE
jgi:ATP-binding cassette subfamily F protein 3